MTGNTTNIVPSTIPQSAIQEARDYLSQGRTAEAWNVLAQAGERSTDGSRSWKMNWKINLRHPQFHGHPERHIMPEEVSDAQAKYLQS